MVDTVGDRRAAPLQIHALSGTIEAIKSHIFNGVIWPDFSQIPSSEAPFIVFHEVEVGQTLNLGNKLIEVLPAVHTVPAVGYAVSAEHGYWVFSGDTERNPAFWERLNQLDVDMLVIETAFSNRERELARRSRHLSPHTLAQELEGIAPGKRFPIYITHTKPSETELIIDEIRRFDQTHTPPMVSHDIRWLQAGQEFEL